MDLKSGYPWWIVRNGLPSQFAPLAADGTCDVAVIGAGITGSLVARELAGAGMDVVVLDRRDAGWGSTAASTALIQYEIDTELAELSRRLGEADAVRMYRACVAAVDEFASIAGSVPRCGITRAQSLYLASRRWHAGRLRREAELRRRHGIEVETLEADAVDARFGIDAPLGLLSAVGASVDPYAFTRSQLAALARSGVRVHDRTTVVDHEPHARGLDLRTDRGHRLRCRHVIVACGYESQAWIPQRVAANRSSYALVTEPLRSMPAWLARTMIWESARPYLYVRATRDHRLVIGGEDDRIDIPLRRDARVPGKAATLLRRLARWLPDLELEPGFAWAGTFAETADGLPFFGPHPALDRRILFAMAYGGNGIVYSVIGAGLLRATIERRRHPLRRLLSFDRIG
ncbi:MAG: FAD-dependent oxidoreductase [Xanthomonadales bacterium]|nr:FAD-dependent oxidoreductase [Xanthomonadales bacterium]